MNGTTTKDRANDRARCEHVSPWPGSRKARRGSKEQGEKARAYTLGIFHVGKGARVHLDHLFVVWIFLHAHEIVRVFDGALTEAIVVGKVVELRAVHVRQMLARFRRVVALSRNQYLGHSPSFGSSWQMQTTPCNTFNAQRRRHRAWRRKGGEVLGRGCLHNSI